MKIGRVMSGYFVRGDFVRDGGGDCVVAREVEIVREMLL